MAWNFIIDEKSLVIFQNTLQFTISTSNVNNGWNNQLHCTEKSTTTKVNFILLEIPNRLWKFYITTLS